MPAADSTVEGDVRWHHGQTLAAGQVAEFKVWAELVRQSHGGLHVFLPLRDVGIDGVLHRLHDGAYVPIQVKGRTSLTPAGQVHITVTDSSLVDDEAFIIATVIDGPELGRLVLVIQEVEFRRLAAHDIVDGREYLTAAFEMHADGRSRWAPHLVPRENLAERFAITPSAPAAAPPPELGGVVDRGQEGFIGEVEVIRRLADMDGLALFRPFPDLETVEVLARDRTSKRWVGLQVKTAGWDASHLETRVYFRQSSFRAAPSTFVCVLGWERETHRFAKDVLLVPSKDIAGLARPEGEWLVLELQPGSPAHRHLDRYRVPLDLLGRAVARVV